MEQNIKKELSKEINRLLFQKDSEGIMAVEDVRKIE